MLGGGYVFADAGDTDAVAPSAAATMVTGAKMATARLRCLNTTACLLCLVVSVRPERVPGRLTRGPPTDRCSDYVLSRRLDWYPGQETIRSGARRLTVVTATVSTIRANVVTFVSSIVAMAGGRRNWGSKLP